MKKLPVILCACMALSGCADFEPDLDRAAAERDANRAAYHQEFGCHFANDHASYRECLLNTYRAEKPKTYTVSQDDKGRSVAIIKDETKQSYDKSTDTYKTERIIVIETEETLVPLPPQTIVTETQQVVTQETVKQPVTPQALPESEPIADKAPVTEPRQETETPVTPAQKSTWWETYKKTKSDESAAIQCPCPDPNVPCPQCVDK